MAQRRDDQADNPDPDRLQDHEHEKKARPDRGRALDEHSRQGQKGQHGQRPGSRPEEQRKSEKTMPAGDTVTHDFGGTGGLEA